jgi:hypothetical protein
LPTNSAAGWSSAIPRPSHTRILSWLEQDRFRWNHFASVAT